MDNGFKFQYRNGVLISVEADCLDVAIDKAKNALKYAYSIDKQPNIINILYKGKRVHLVQVNNDGSISYYR